MALLSCLVGIAGLIRISYGMASRWGEWSETVVDSDNKDRRVDAESMFCLLLFYNCNYDVRAIIDNRGDCQVNAWLKSQKAEWPVEFGSAKVVDACNIGISTDPTIKNGETLADVLTCTVVLAERKGMACTSDVFLSHAEKKGRSKYPAHRSHYILLRRCIRGRYVTYLVRRSVCITSSPCWNGILS